MIPRRDVAALWVRMEHDGDPHTDPRVNAPIPTDQVPLLVAHVRKAANEVRIAAEMIARQAGGGLLYREATTLAQHACRLAQWATMASALPPVPPPLAPLVDVEVRVPAGMPRWRAVFRAVRIVLSR